MGYIGAYFAADEAEITNVAVDMEYRRRHIAEALVAEMQKKPQSVEPTVFFRSALQ